MRTVTDTVTLWFESGVPKRMVWNGQRWRVTDMPTELFGEVDALPAAITHPPKQRMGWRFQAADSSGANRVFDLRAAGGTWVIGRIYE